MNESEISAPPQAPGEMRLREELARGDRALAAARPVLRYLLAEDVHGLLGDETVARVRGMVLDVARQLAEAEAAGAGTADAPSRMSARRDVLAEALCEDEVFVGHCHALALELRVAERLRARAAIDPVLTPLVQDLASDGNASLAGLAMAVLAAQARFLQYGRRMELPLRDLPGEQLHRVLLVLRANPGEQPSATEGAERRLRAGYRESDSRPALMERVITALAARGEQALELERAGSSVFLTALGMAAGQERDRVAVALGAGDAARIATMLSAAGLAEADTLRQLAHLGCEAVTELGLPGSEEAADWLLPELAP